MKMTRYLTFFIAGSIVFGLSGCLLVSCRKNSAPNPPPIAPTVTSVPQQKQTPFLTPIPSVETPSATPIDELSNIEYVDAIFTDIPHNFEATVAVVNPKEKYFEGDVVEFSFHVSQPSHVVILDHWVNGEITVLFPNPWEKDTLVEANKIYYVPNREKGFDYPITIYPPYGSDVLQIIACTEANEFHRLIQEITQKAESSAPFAGIDRGVVTRGVRNAVRSTSSIKPEQMTFKKDIQWAEAHIFFPIAPRQP